MYDNRSESNATRDDIFLHTNNKPSKNKRIVKLHASNYFYRVTTNGKTRNPRLNTHVKQASFHTYDNTTTQEILALFWMTWTLLHRITMPRKMQPYVTCSFGWLVNWSGCNTCWHSSINVLIQNKMKKKTLANQAHQEHGC